MPDESVRNGDEGSNGKCVRLVRSAGRRSWTERSNEGVVCVFVCVCVLVARVLVSPMRRMQAGRLARKKLRRLAGSLR